MIERMFGRGSMPALESMMYFASARQRVLANNIANVDTIGYKTLDVPVDAFHRSLAKAFESQRETPTGVWELEATRRIAPKPGGGLSLKTLEAGLADSGILKHTENNVDLELEMAKMVKNSGLHQAAASLLAQQFSMLRSAIAERVLA